MSDGFLPIVSIVIPAYNAEKYLKSCLDSISSQSVSGVETIIVDDGSTDRTAEIAEQYIAGSSCFKLVRQENGGVSVARKNGVSHANGVFVWFVDSDDCLLDGALETILSCIAEHPEVDTIFAPVMMHDEQRGKEWVKPYAEPDGMMMRGKDYLRKQPVSVCPVQFVFRKSLFENRWIYFPEGLRHEDEYFCRALQYFSSSMLLLREPLYLYRQWGGSFMNSGSIQSLYDMVEVYKHLSSFVENGVEVADRDWLRPDIFSFLMGTHFWHRDILGSSDFRQFRNSNISFLKKEFVRTARYFSKKKAMINGMMLWAPSLFRFIFHA